MNDQFLRAAADISQSEPQICRRNAHQQEMVGSDSLRSYTTGQVVPRADHRVPCGEACAWLREGLASHRRWPCDPKDTSGNKRETRMKRAKM